MDYISAIKFCSNFEFWIIIHHMISLDSDLLKKKIIYNNIDQNEIFINI